MFAFHQFESQIQFECLHRCRFDGGHWQHEKENEKKGKREKRERKKETCNAHRREINTQSNKSFLTSK